MKKLIAALAVFAVMLTAAPASAQDLGLTLGLRAAYGVPIGSVEQDVNLNDQFKGALPLWADVGYRINKNVFAGAYFQYAFAFLADQAKASFPGGTGSDLRLGVQGIYSFLPDAQLNPWAGLGVGYEWANLKATINGVDSTATARGFDAFLQVGGDYRVSDQFAVGPYAAFTFAQFATTDLSGNLSGTAGEIGNKAMHDWFQIGLRGAFNL